MSRAHARIFADRLWRFANGAIESPRDDFRHSHREGAVNHKRPMMTRPVAADCNLRALGKGIRARRRGREEGERAAPVTQANIKYHRRRRDPPIAKRGEGKERERERERERECKRYSARVPVAFWFSRDERVTVKRHSPRLETRHL